MRLWSMLRDVKEEFTVEKDRVGLKVEQTRIFGLLFTLFCDVKQKLRCFWSARRDQCRQGLEPCLSMYLLRENDW